MIPLIVAATATPEQAALLARTPPINLFALLAHAPGLASRVAGLGSAVMTSDIDPALREMVAIRVGWKLGADYVEGQHRRVAGLLSLPARIVDAAIGGPSGHLSPLQHDVLALADAIADCKALDVRLASRLEAELGREGLVGLVVTAGYFVMLGGVTRAFSLPLEPAPPPA